MICSSMFKIRSIFLVLNVIQLLVNTVVCTQVFPPRILPLTIDITLAITKNWLLCLKHPLSVCFHMVQER